MTEAQTLHATALILGTSGVLIRGPSGCGKSLLARHLIETAPRHGLARLVADDQVVLTVAHGRLIAAPPATLAGLLELRGFGIAAVEHEPACVVRLVVDIVADGALERLPEEADRWTVLRSVRLARQAVPHALDHAASLVRAALDARLTATM